MTGQDNQGYSHEELTAITAAAIDMHTFMLEDRRLGGLQYKFEKAAENSRPTLSVSTEKIVPLKPINLHEEAKYLLMRHINRHKSPITVEKFEDAAYFVESIVAAGLGLTSPKLGFDDKPEPN